MIFLSDGGNRQSKVTHRVNQEECCGQFFFFDFITSLENQAK